MRAGAAAFKPSHRAFRVQPQPDPSPAFKGGAGISGRGTDRKTGLSPKPDERRGGRLCLPDA